MSETMGGTANGTMGRTAGEPAIEAVGHALSDIHPDRELDCRGLSCPLPVLRTRKALDAMLSGQVLRLVATDPGSANDMPAWTRHMGHALLKTEQPFGQYVFYIQKK